jgi:predicted nucleic acid-binding protein
VKILLDTNVVLDVALARQPFYQAAARILDASDFDKIHLFVTASSATDLYYVLRKEKGRDVGLKFIRRLLECVDACAVDEAILNVTLASDFRDFEDAVQNAAAIDSGIEIIVTRNTADYRASPLMVLGPEEFAAAHLV